MTKCLTCKTGKMVVSGSHLYCENCGLTIFHMTTDYIHASAALIAVLVSNTRFRGEPEFIEIVHDHVKLHLPMLQGYIDTVIQGREELIKSFVDTVKDQSINLQIGDGKLNFEDAARELRCQCGCEPRFIMINPGKVMCVDCEANYEYDQYKGVYVPKFLCACGWAAVQHTDPASGLCHCTECGKPHIYSKLSDTYRPV